MIGRNVKFAHGIALGLTIVALIAIVVALIVGYVNNGEINFVLIGLAAAVLTANFLTLRRRRRRRRRQAKSGE